MAVDFKYIKEHLPQPTQFICATCSYKYDSSAGKYLLDKVVAWIKNMNREDYKLNRYNCIDGILMYTVAMGTEDEMRNAAINTRTRKENEGVRYWNWKTSWRVLPADGRGHWIPSDSIIKKALKVIENS